MEYPLSTTFRLLRRRSLWLLAAFFVVLSYFSASNLLQKIDERAEARGVVQWRDLDAGTQAEIPLAEAAARLGECAVGFGGATEADRACPSSGCFTPSVTSPKAIRHLQPVAHPLGVAGAQIP